ESGPPRTPIVRVWAVADVTSAMAHDKPMTSERIAFSWIGEGADCATRKRNLMRASGESQHLLELIIGGIFGEDNRCRSQGRDRPPPAERGPHLKSMLAATLRHV